MENYLMIGDKRFPLNEVMKRLGVEGVSACEVRLCQEVRSGVIKAGVSCDPFYPAIYLDFQPKDAPSALSIPISTTEQPTEGDCPVRSYLYDREDQYFAYSDLDIRSDDEVDKELRSPEIVVSGEPYMDTVVKFENQFVQVEK